MPRVELFPFRYRANSWRKHDDMIDAAAYAFLSLPATGRVASAGRRTMDLAPDFSHSGIQI